MVYTSQGDEGESRSWPERDSSSPRLDRAPFASRAFRLSSMHCKLIGTLHSRPSLKGHSGTVLRGSIDRIANLTKPLFAGDGKLPTYHRQARGCTHLEQGLQVPRQTEAE